MGGLAAVLSSLATLVVALAGTAWQAHAPLPVARTEVAAAPFRGDVAVVGGYLADGTSTDDVDLYDPATDGWSRLPDLPVAVNHASAASAGGKLYVAGGYGGPGVRLRSAFVFDGDRWRALAPMPAYVAPLVLQLSPEGSTSWAGWGPTGLHAGRLHST